MSTNRTVTIDQFADALQEELTLYSKSVITALKKEAEKAMKTLVQETKATAPVGRSKRHYKDCITSRKESESENAVSYIWYVESPDYRLSHLLNNGHALRNGGRYPGTQFITTAHNAVIADYEKAVEEVIKRAD